MTAQELTEAEQEIVDRFEAAPEPEEITVERVARALFAKRQEIDGDFYVVAWEDNYAREDWYALAAAAVAALAPQADDGPQGIWLR
jgi:hypothetical protein